MRAWLLTISVLGLVACSKGPEHKAAAPEPAPQAQTAEPASAIDAAIASTERLPDDYKQDEWRRPAEVLEFMGLEPGMRVLDYFSAGGYYTELISRVVGPEGAVIAYNNEPYRKYAKDVPDQRYGNNRLPNVTEITAPVEEAPFEPESVDAALFMMAAHEFWWRPKDQSSWPTIDPAKALERVVKALKPGAVVVIVDHVANAGSDPIASVDQLHRIDPAVLRQAFEAAGLKFETENNAFRNEADDHSKPVFDPSVQNKTDKIMYRFRKA
ncbi:MAG TPA: methyltransferase domain-containing protein [Steroidobacter sp.]